MYSSESTYLGALQRRFSIFTKRFDVEDELGQPTMQVASPIYRLWTFPFTRNGEQLAVVKKKWSGALTEIFTDKDNFEVEFNSPALSENERTLLLASSVFIDLLYFEHKASSGIFDITD